MIPNCQLITSMEVQFLVFKGNDLVSNALRNGGYEADLHALSEGILRDKKDGVVLDIGANLGSYCIPLAKKHPHIKIVATTLREVHSTNRHSWGAVAWIDGATYVSPTCELDVVDRVGGGDGYAAGFFYGLLGGESPQDAVNLGWAHGALLTTFPGDTTMATADQVRAFAHGGSARIQR
jgi:sugar/nucleoside kinase (ribokinase family)